MNSLEHNAGFSGTEEEVKRSANHHAERCRELADILIVPPGVTRQDVCIWTQDSDGPWCGSCGVMWEFIDGGPKDNETHFCPRCGGVLLAEPFAEDETPNT